MPRRKSLLPPYLKWRDGRPRWEPGPKLRDSGWKGRNLQDEAGKWLGLEAAIAAATEINEHVAAWQLGAPRRQRPTKTKRTCAAMIEMYFSSQDFRDLAPNTQRDYRNKAGLWLDAGFHDAPVAALTKPIMLGWWEATHEQRGHAMANGILAVVRKALSYAELKGWRPENSNPARQLGRKTVAPRVIVFTPAEVSHLVACADREGGSLEVAGDIIVLALHTGQRLSDVLAFEEPSRNDRGQIVFAIRQQKRRARVAVPATDQIIERIDRIRHRRQSGPVAELRIDGPLILDPRTGRPFDANSYGKVFRRLRALASVDMPAIAAKKFLDLRDTAVTRLALAGCTIPEIRAITGHTLTTIHAVLEHYLALDDAQAEAAISKLRDWMQQEGIAL